MLWPTLYLSDEVLHIYSANLNLLITSLTVPRRRKLKTEVFSLKTAGKSGKINDSFRYVCTGNTVLCCFSHELWSFKFNFIHRYKCKISLKLKVEQMIQSNYIFIRRYQGMLYIF